MKIPLFKIYWDETDVEAVTKVIERGSYWATGPEIAEFERMVAEYVGRKYGVAFNSGTSALHALLLAYKIHSGDEVIVPSFTFISTANAPLFVRAKPIFAEIEEETYCLDEEDVKKKINKKTKAIMPIHYGGCACKTIKALHDLAEDYNILLLEDAAESLGATKDNTFVGNFGNAAMFSFCHNKVITTGEGGIVVTDDKKIYQRLKLIHSHGREENKNYFENQKNIDYITLGYNFRMPTLNAALGISQLKKIEKIITMRQRNAEMLTQKLNALKIVTPPICPNNQKCVYQMYTVKVGYGLRDSLMKYLLEKGIFTKVYFEPVHLTTYYRSLFGFKEGDLPITEEISNKVLTLPMYPSLTNDEIDYIAEGILEFERGEVYE